MTPPRAHLVVDLGFGDAGKGHIVDHLVRSTGARWVVRTNGGAQAGHTVVLDDGRAHTFAQFGAGSFVAGVRTLLAEPVVVHPTALLVEAQVLEGKGVAGALARLSAAAGCRVITPFHQAANRLRELARDTTRHGSCGVGVGETVADSLVHPDETITLGMLRDPPAVRRRLARVRERKHDELRAVEVLVHGDVTELRVFEDASVVETWLERACSVSAAIDLVEPGAAAPMKDGDVIFEGAQGVLLDERFGFHPYTSWSSCTFANPDALLEVWGSPHARRRIGVLRSYHVRHGPGPLPTETRTLDVLDEPHNLEGPWQGRFRRGYFDLVLARYAIEAVGGIDYLALTHLDAMARDLDWRIATGYGAELVVPRRASLDDSTRLCALLGRVVPTLAPLAGDDADGRATALRAAIAESLRVTIGLESWGRAPADVRHSSRKSSSVCNESSGRVAKRDGGM